MTQAPRKCNKPDPKPGPPPPPAPPREPSPATAPAPRGGSRYAFSRTNPPPGQWNSPMPLSRADHFAILDRLGIKTETVEHPPLFTVEESQALRGSIDGGHTRTSS